MLARNPRGGKGPETQVLTKMYLLGHKYGFVCRLVLSITFFKHIVGNRGNIHWKILIINFPMYTAAILGMYLTFILDLKSIIMFDGKKKTLVNGEIFYS